MIETFGISLLYKIPTCNITIKYVLLAKMLSGYNIIFLKEAKKKQQTFTV